MTWKVTATTNMMIAGITHRCAALGVLLNAAGPAAASFGERFTHARGVTAHSELLRRSPACNPTAMYVPMLRDCLPTERYHRLTMYERREQCVLTFSPRRTLAKALAGASATGVAIEMTVCLTARSKKCCR